MNNSEVMQKWLDGDSAKNSKKNMTTDGWSLWSYQMLIGITLDDGSKHLLTLAGESRVSVTTQRHARAWSYRNVGHVPVRRRAYFRSNLRSTAE